MGRSVYSPAAIAGYAALCGLPVAYILHGLNLRARGYIRLGFSWVGFGAACLGVLFVLPESFAPARGFMLSLGVFGGIALFQLESGPYQRAIAQGATRALWWPPALIVIGATIIQLIATFVLEAVA